MRRVPHALLAALLVVGTVGCDDGPRTGKAADTRTPAEYFRDRQAATVTPNGKIAPGTVAERDGRIEYGTADGKRWRVPYSRRADGTYEYGTPEEVK